MIPEKHKVAMIELLSEYVGKHKFIPQGMYLDINLDIKPIVSELTPKILYKDAQDSFKEYFIKNQKKVPRMVLNIFTDTGMATVKDVVTFGVGHKYGVSGAWVRIRKCGQKSRDLIDEWLRSIGLHRGMRF